MLDTIIKFSLHNKLMVLLGAVILMLGGLYTANNMDVDVFPDLTAPTVVVMTDAHGKAAEEVERLVTFPIETAVNGATDVRRVRSASSHGFSFVWVEFDWGTDVFRARQIVSEKLVTLAGQLPLGISQPVLAPQSSVMGEILFIGLQSDSTDKMTLRTIADWQVKPLLLATGGVSQVTIIGGDYKQYKVLADPHKMMHYGVTLDELANVCRGISQNSTGGVMREYGNEYVVRGVGRSDDLEVLGNSLIRQNNGQPVYVYDVADVVIEPAVKMGYASQNATPAVILSISKQPNTNTLELTERIEANLHTLSETLPADVRLDTKIFRQADFIETSVNNVQRALIEGGLFVVIILFLFLGSFRTTVISLLAIPLSLLGAVITLKYLNLNINTMSLGGMAIAIGSLVDDAIIDVENVYKRLRQNHQLAKEKRESTLTIVYEASKEIRASILNATLIIIVAFVPLFFLSGMEGRMLRPLGIAYIVALFMSLIIAMTTTPLLCRLLLTGDNYLNRKEKDSRLTRSLQNGYQTSLHWALRHKAGFLIVSVIAFIVSMGVLGTMGRSFLPEFNEGALTISAVSQPGVSLEKSNELGNLIETELLDIPEVTSTARRTGRGELDEHSQTTNSAEIDVNFIVGERGQEAFMAEVRHRLANVPGVATTVGQPLGHRIDHMLSGTRANIAIKLFGQDLNQLFVLGNQLKAAISDIEGLVDVNVEQQTEVPQIQIKADRGKLAMYGITLNEFNEFIDVAFAGEKLADIYEGQQSYDLLLRFNHDYTNSIEGLKKALIDAGDGKKVPLEEVSQISSAAGPGIITRENVQRKLVVSANVAERDLRSVVNDIREEVKQKISLPDGYRIEYGGQFESEAKASQTLMLTSFMAICIIFLLLYQEFKNMQLAAIILINLPLALIGGVFAIKFTSGIVSIPAIIGFITLFGIATRNGILLISNYQHMKIDKLGLTDLVVHGSVDRLNPILMTALTAALALIPLALNGDQPGNEIQSPMAKVILGGLLTSTLLNMYVIPIVYYLLQKRKSASAAKGGLL
ncbi:efflux RND transporter permease subunit [Carboxylicivirga mesophila]|uniref:Efflux RND transporter permease subunit n=1 Tax=Carboxylicivirga mesophila TaxID=1166478 RepID=A0ABS5KED2_9BACT|nr:efflux RND transporter permease subunit [Carboxylicivirga mesophila]MBS2213274.1 efflux RND transporter permease subunit [Carboxylicivirga mesophila]